MLVVPACLVVATAFLMEVRVNFTASMPRGIYLTSDRTPARGELVDYCLTGSWAKLARERGYLASGRCPSGLRPLLKVLAGVPGDRVAVENGTVCINGVAWPHGIRKLDSSGRPVPSCLESTTIPAGRALVLSPHEGSFDGRYFGLVPFDSLQKVNPVFLLEVRNEEGQGVSEGRSCGGRTSAHGKP